MRTWRCSTRSPDPFLSCSGTATCEPPHSPRPAAESFPRREILQEEKQRACRQRAAKIIEVVIGISDPFWQGTGKCPGELQALPGRFPCSRSRQGQQTWLVPLCASSPLGIIPLVLPQPFAAMFAEFPSRKRSGIRTWLPSALPLLVVQGALLNQTPPEQLLLACSLPGRCALTTQTLQKVAIRGSAGLVMGQRWGQPRCRLWCLSTAGSRGRQSKHVGDLQPGAAPDLPGPEHPPVLCGSGGFWQQGAEPLEMPEQNCCPQSGSGSVWCCHGSPMVPNRRRLWL